MRKNRFLALTMLCSVLSGVSVNAQEVKNSGSQTTGEVKNSSGNKGTSNSDKNVEKITKKAPNSKKVEGGNSSGSKKSDVKKGDKEVTKDKAKDSVKVEGGNSSGSKKSDVKKGDKEVTKDKVKDSVKVEGGNSSGSKKSDVKKGDKEVTKDKAKDSGEVSSKSFEWEDFKKKFGDGVSSFVDLVKRHPVWSSITGIGGGCVYYCRKRKRT